ncbi:hypothetical protein BOTBODRAFT_34349 [Botryobasidium botryosum FD-172 SS1]|uniref:CAAX prenyl protease n=1 Tax=Botryobasidium botryosum (strain FD-172 SS1) TaxID=930990 RepID=A0A067MA36_BOTB1|nr:hypothetical protein BOTBODRAFT_34349 [Botryobasidium botryosum FD-172 SS1]
MDVLSNIQERLAFISTDPIDWKSLVISFSWSVWAFESYLLIRQYPLYSKEAPPPQLAAHFTPEVFAKSQRYGRDKARFSIVSGFFSQTLDWMLIQYGAQAWAWEAAGKLLHAVGYTGSLEIPQSIFFATILTLMSAIPNLPFSAYNNFVLEEKHGFNKMTPLLFITDTLKGWFIGFVIGAPFLAGFLWIVRWAGDRFIPWLMGFMVSFQMIMVVLYPLVIQPLFNKLSPLPQDELRTRIEALASRLSFPLKHLYVIDGSKRSAHSNAYFYGLPWSKHIVIYDTLIKKTKPEEIEAVLAHELGHWHYSHPSKLLVISQLHLWAIFSVFPPFLRSAPLLRSFGFPADVTANPPILVAFLLFQMVLTPVEAVVGMLMNAVSRRFEWEADRFALELGENDVNQAAGMPDMGERLGNALVGLHVENLSTVWVDKLYSTYHHSHPTLTERLKAMEDYRVRKAKKNPKKEL